MIYVYVAHPLDAPLGELLYTNYKVLHHDELMVS